MYRQKQITKNINRSELRHYKKSVSTLLIANAWVKTEVIIISSSINIFVTQAHCVIVNE